MHLVAATLSSESLALYQQAQVRQALVEIDAAHAAMNIPAALALREHIMQLR